MKPPTFEGPRPLARLQPRLGICLVLGVLAAGLLLGADAVPLAPPAFDAALRSLRAADGDTARVEAARAVLRHQAVSSLQVKAMAGTIANEDLRLEFAVAAYPVVVDPENFYEVYDAFQSFSKVFRLHDRVAPRVGPASPLPPVAVVPLNDQEFAQLLRTVRNEAFDNTRLAASLQIVRSARGRITSRQVRELLRTFTFEDGRLELAKAAYDCVTDPWNYSVTYDTFTFASNREALARYIQQAGARGGN